MTQDNGLSSGICDDCDHPSTKITTYGMGMKRCPICRDFFDKKRRAERAERDRIEAERQATHRCDADDDMTCPECCVHDFDPDEGFTCLNCGSDGSERVQSLAYDKEKDRRKYGDE